MKLLDYLDRRAERNALRPPLDTRLIVGFSFLAGYYLLIFYIADRQLPPANVELVKDSLLILGPAVGVIIGALFRTDVRDIQQTANTGKAFAAVEAAAAAGTSSATPQDVRVINPPSDPVPTVEDVAKDAGELPEAERLS